MLPLVSYFAVVLGVTAAIPWISVPLSSTTWVPVLEVAPGRRFLLHPQATVVNVSFPRGCSRFLPTIIDVQFWDIKTLRLTETMLKDQGLCKNELLCRLEPYQARYLLIRDQLRVWKPIPSRRYIPLSLPSTMRFSIIRNNKSSCTAPTVRDLSGLVFDLSGNSGRSSTESVILEANITGLIKPKFIDNNKSSERELELEKEVNRLKAQLAMQSIGQFSNIQCPNRTQGNISISDCLDVKLCNLKEGLYFLRSLGRQVFCFASGEMLVFKRTKIDRTFQKRWNNYLRGMGKAQDKNYFIGLRAMSRYTASEDKCMNVILTPKNESLPTRSGQYSNFVIGHEIGFFKLFYKKFSGTLTKDPFRYHRRRYFTTEDRSSSLSVGCAKSYKGGNWYVSCFEISLFGTVGASNLAFSSKGLSKEKPQKHYDLRAAYMTLRKVSGDPQALVTIFADFTPICPTRIQEWTVPETAEYVITAGGASGGRTPHVNSPRGGRGALVRMRVLLKEDAKLRFVIGCAGEVGIFSGAGGDGTFVVDKTRQKLLIAAGGGGGAGWKSGGDGQSSKEGGEAKSSPLRPVGSGKVRMIAAKNWWFLESKMLRGPSNDTGSTGGATFSDDNRKDSSSGGGGGGYRGGLSVYEGGFDGERDEPVHSAGGGGGSICDEMSSRSCEVLDGGNLRSQGFIKVEAYRCFQEE